MVNESENGKFWVGKKAKIFIKKDGKDLIFTATVLEIDIQSVTFIDRDGIIYSFSRTMVFEMKVIS